ncbi:MAG: TniB family NTP-binding protein [Paracoccaceae bacterium]
MDPRIEKIGSDRWIGFGRASSVLHRMVLLMETPRQTRMPGLIVYGSSGIGKTMIANRMASQFPPVYDELGGVTRRPLLLFQAPPAPDERRFYLHILATIGAPQTPSRTLAEIEIRTLAFLREIGPKMIVIDEVHNLLAGTYREQRRFLNVLRYLTNDLQTSLVCFGVNEAVDAIRGDTQLARRVDEHHLPQWEDDLEFSQLIQTLIQAMELERPSTLGVRSLRRLLTVKGGVTSRIFSTIRELSIDAIESGEERITDEAVEGWRPRWHRTLSVDYTPHPADF